MTINELKQEADNIYNLLDEDAELEGLDPSKIYHPCREYADLFMELINKYMESHNPSKDQH